MIDLKKNSVIWDGTRDGFYEAYYIQVNDPVSGMAWWFRYSILVPKAGRGTPYAALWAIQYDPSGACGPIAMKHISPLNHFRYEKDRFILYLEDGFMTNSHATGKIRHGDRGLEWDIQWVPDNECFIHYPDLWYKTSFPSSKVVSPHWATTGGGFVRWNEGEFFLSDALIHVGHVWGNSHSKKWVWVHSHGFEENEKAVFEGLWAPICGPFGMSMCWLQIDGERQRFIDFGANWNLSRFMNKHTWPLKLGNSAFQLRGDIAVDPSQIAGITYHDPDGGHRFCYNSKIASINMDLKNKKSGERSTLTAPNMSAFEFCVPEEVSQFKMLV